MTCPNCRVKSGFEMYAFLVPGDPLPRPPLTPCSPIATQNSLTSEETYLLRHAFVTRRVQAQIEFNILH